MTTTRKHYSQNAEQEAILAAFPYNGPIWIGDMRFLDIGAWHATDKSNTRALFERGWGGVLVEPSPGPFAGLQKEYGDCERITLINAAVCFDGNPVMMYLSDDALSTSHTETYEKWKPYAQFTPEPVEVPGITIDAIYETHGPFDFVSIDAEGVSVDILHHLLALTPLPKCICIEYDDRLPEVLTAATARGYSATYCSGENVVLVK